MPMLLANSALEKLLKRMIAIGEREMAKRCVVARSGHWRKVTIAKYLPVYAAPAPINKQRKEPWVWVPRQSA